MLAGSSARTALSVRAGAPRAFSTARVGGIPIAALDDHRASVNLTVALKAGSRYQSAPGAAAALRHWLFQANDARSALATVRETELRGGLLSTSLSKDHVLINLQFLKPDAPFFVQLVADALSTPKLHTWEYDETVVPQLAAETEAAAHNPVVHGIEALTYTAYHGKGPGQSILASLSTPLSYENARQYVKTSLASDRVAIAASGLGQGKLASLVERSFSTLPTGFPASDNQPQLVQYFGGQARVPLASHGAPDHVFLAFDAAGVDALALAVLAQLLGGKSHVKWSSGLSALSQVSSKFTGTLCEAFHLPYEGGAGLFGIHVQGPSVSVTDALKASVEALKSIAGGQTDGVEAAVAQAKYALASSYESPVSSELAASALVSGSDAPTVTEHVNSLQVSASAVSEAAAKLLTSTPTLAAVGNEAQLPYAEDVL